MEDGTIIGFVVTGVICLVIGYFIGARSAGAGSAAQSKYSPPPQPVEPQPRHRVEAYSVDAPRPNPAQRHPAPPRPGGQPKPAAAPIFVADQRPDDDRTVMRKLRSAREAFQESKGHLEHPPEDDEARFGGKKKE